MIEYCITAGEGTLVHSGVVSRWDFEDVLDGVEIMHTAGLKAEVIHRFAPTDCETGS